MPVASTNTVRHYESVDEVLAVLEEDVVADEMRRRFPLHAMYDYLWAADGSLIPSKCSSFISPFVYRGQVARYRPCLPSVFRGLSRQANHAEGWKSLTLADRARLFVERVRMEEFVLALHDHPARAYAEEVGIRLQPFGLAQHYEMATDRLDLTQDHHVAAFFATNARIGNEWVPVDEGVGVIYRLHANSFFDRDSKHFECVGKQSLPRPEQQRAFTLTLPLAYDFEKFPIEIFTFRQVESCGRSLNDRFTGGHALFPPDVMAEVAAAIRSEQSISRHVVAWLLSYDERAPGYLGDSFNDVEKLVTQYSGVGISERGRITLTASQQEQASASVERMRPTFMDNVGAIAVREENGKPVEYCCLRTRQKVPAIQ